MKQVSKSSALKTVEMSKTYALVLYSSGAVMLRRTAFPYNSISVNAELVPFLDASIRDVVSKMVEDGRALRAAIPAQNAKMLADLPPKRGMTKVYDQSEIETIIENKLMLALDKLMAKQA